MGTKVYNADEVVISIGGSTIDGGFADGVFLRIEETADKVQSVAGTDGEVAISRVKDNRATATLILLQTSKGNDLMSAKFNAAKAGIGSPSIGDFYVRDLNGRAVFEASACWIVKGPDAEFDRTATPREWQLGLADLDPVHGGNNAA